MFPFNAIDRTTMIRIGNIVHHDAFNMKGNAFS